MTTLAPLEIGFVVAGRPGTRERRLIGRGAVLLRRELRRAFPTFDWKIELLRRPDIGARHGEASTELLRHAAELRDEHRWDLVLMVTANELVARYRPFALAALSRPLDAAVVSTARLLVEGDVAGAPLILEERSLERSSRREKAHEDDVHVDRLATLLVHAIAHLGGEASVDDPARFLFRPGSPAELDAMRGFDGAERARLVDAFGEIADARLEETDASLDTRWRFVLRAARINRGEILDAVLAARPWEFPQRLSRLTTAAVSTVSLMLLTAESWDLGLSQGWHSLLAMYLVVLAFTTGFVVLRQQLLVVRSRRISEQLVVTGISAVLIVMLGLAVTWSCMFSLALLTSSTLFDANLIVVWAGSAELDPASVGVEVRLRISVWCASIGLLIGSLGASFENQQHFQHVIFVDEEL